MIRSYEWDGHINTWHLLRLLACTVKLLCRMRLDITPEPLKGAFSLTKKKTKNPKNPTKQRNWTVSKKKVCESQICSVIYVHMTISVLWTVSCEIFGGLKGSLSFLCKIGITDLNYHCQQELSFMWTCNLRGGHKRIKFWVCWGRRMVQGWMLEPQVLHVI